MFDIQSGPVGILCCQSQVKKSAARSPRPRNPPKGFTLWNHPMGFCCPPGSKTLSHYQLFNSTMVHLHQNIENHMWENPKSQLQKTGNICFSWTLGVASANHIRDSRGPAPEAQSPKPFAACNGWSLPAYPWRLSVGCYPCQPFLTDGCCWLPLVVKIYIYIKPEHFDRAIPTRQRLTTGREAMLPASVGNATLQCPNHSTGQCQEPKNLLDRRPVPSTDWSQCGFPLTPFPAFTPQSLCTEQLFNTDAFTQSTFYASLYTEQLLRANAFTHRRWYTEQPSPTDTFTLRSQLLHTNAFARSSFYTKTLLHREAFTEQLLHREWFRQGSNWVENYGATGPSIGWARPDRRQWRKQAEKMEGKLVSFLILEGVFHPSWR